MDSFFRPRIQGSHPCPRFTTTSVLWNSYLVFHGGFSTQRSMALNDMVLLELVPALQRPVSAFPLEPRAPFYLPVTDHEVIELRQREEQRRQHRRDFEDAMNGEHTHVQQAMLLSLLFRGGLPGLVRRGGGGGGFADVDEDDDDEEDSDF